MHTGDDAAVSPVVAVILLVAVTVALSAVVGAFALNIGEQTTDAQQSDLGVKTSQSNGTVTVTVVTGTADKLTLKTSNGSIQTISNPSPGDTASISANSSNSVTIISTTDGTSSVVTSTTVSSSNSTSSTGPVAPTQGLVSYWSFDDNTVSSGVVSDEAGSNEGDINGPTTSVTGISGESFSYAAGSEENVTVQDAGTIPSNLKVNTQSHTVVGWFKVNGSLGPGTDNRTVGYHYGDNWRYGLWVSGDTIRVHQSPDNGGGVYQDLAWSQDESWHMIGQVYNATTGNISIIYDGEIYRAADSSFNQDKSASGLYIGKQSGKAGYAWQGKIDEMRVYNRSLNDSEVSDLYNATK